MDELKQKLEQQEDIIDALSTAVRKHKDAVKKLEAENEKLKSQQKLKDDLQRKTQSDYEELKAQLAEALSKLERQSDYEQLKAQLAEAPSELQRLRDIHLGSDSYRSPTTLQDRQDVSDMGSESYDEWASDKLYGKFINHLFMAYVKDFSESRRRTARCYFLVDKAWCKHVHFRQKEIQIGSESIRTYERHRDIQLGSASYRSTTNLKERKGVCDSQPTEERNRTFKKAFMPISNKHRLNCPIVGAIHIGETFSSIGFQLISDPTRISSYLWQSDSRLDVKTITAILIDENKEFVNFGYPAEDKYDQLQLEDEHRKYFFFKDFLRPLNSVASASGFDENMMIKDDFNKKIQVVTILSMMIKYLADLLFSIIKKSGYAWHDIHWMLIFPPSSTNGFQNGMQRAAEKAGIQLNNLTLVPHPIAVYAYFRYPDNTGKTRPTVQESTKYMIMDIGGPATNVSIIDVGETGKIIGCSWASDETGGVVIEEKMLEQFIVNILGKDVYGKFCKYCRDDYIDLLRCFNSRTSLYEQGTTNLSLPLSLRSLYEDESKQSVYEAVAKCTAYKGQIKMRSASRISVDTELFKSMFNEFLSTNVKCVKDMFKAKTNIETDAIILVEGLLDCTFIRDAIQQHFPMNRLFILDRGDSHVLKGAVCHMMRMILL